MTSTFKKAFTAVALSGALLTTTFTPFTEQATTAAAATKVTKIPQMATVADKTPVYAKSKDVLANKPAIKLDANTYVKKIDTVTIGDDRYYLVKYDNRIAYEKGKADEYTTVLGYIHISDVKTVVHEYEPLKKNANYTQARNDYASTERYAFKKSGWYNTSARFDNVGEAEYYPKNEFGVLIGERNISSSVGYETYAVLRVFGGHVYMKKSLLKKDFATNVKNYSKAAQKIKYKTVQKTILRSSYGANTYVSQLGEALKKGTTFTITKEATYKGKVYVYVKNVKGDRDPDDFNEGWLLKKRTTK